MLKKQAITLGLAIAGCSALWSVGASAQTDSDTQATLKALQAQIQLLQQQVTDLQKKQAPSGLQSQSSPVKYGSTGSSSSDADVPPVVISPDDENKEAAKVADSGPVKKLNVGGGVAANYRLRNGEAVDSRRDGGDLIFNYFALNFTGQYGKLTYSAEQRFSETNFADSSYLHYGWAAYDFNDRHQVKGGYFQVPFGNYPFGYQSFFGNLAYFSGFTDNQAAGVGYKYENDGLRLDIDAFKNNRLQQNSTYGSNAIDGYEEVNGGNARLGYTFNHDKANNVDVSASARGGQLEVGTPGIDSGVTSDYGTWWAASLASQASLGLWTLQGQYINYKYNIPEDRTFGGNPLPTDSITKENYGFRYQMPASGQLYTANIGRSFPVEQGPISAYNLYTEYGLLDVGGDGTFTSTLADGSIGQVGNPQTFTLGASMNAGPVYIWADAMMGKNAAQSFNGPNNGDWQPRLNIAFAYYFDADIIK